MPATSQLDWLISMTAIKVPSWFRAARPQPAGQPEPVASRLERDDDTRDLAPGLGRLAPPALKQAQQRRCISRKLLQRVARDPGDDAGDEPTRSAHLDDRD